MGDIYNTINKNIYIFQKVITMQKKEKSKVPCVAHICD